MWGFIVALISGVLMSVQGVFNTDVTKATSIWVSNTWVQFTALIICLFGWGFADRSNLLGVFQADHKYALFGGVIGAFITLTVVKSMDQLGPAQAVLTIVIAQLLAAYLIEVFGMFGVEKVGFHWNKVIGMIVSIAGLVIFKMK